MPRFIPHLVDDLSDTVVHAIALPDAETCSFYRITSINKLLEGFPYYLPPPVPLACATHLIASLSLDVKSLAGFLPPML